MVKRNVHFFDMKITSKGKLNRRENPILFEATPKSLSEIAADINQLFENNDNLLQKGRLEKSASHYLKDFRITEHEIIMLVNRCDPNAPDTATSDPENKEHMVHKKPPGHGGDFSAHVVIKKKPVLHDNYYLCMIETLVGSGLNSTVIKSYLNHVINKCRYEFKEKYTITDISDQKVKVRHVHQLAFQGHPSHSFVQDLENGRLSGIEAISYSGKGNSMDSTGGIVESYRTIQFRSDTSRLGDTINAIKNFRSKVLSEYKEYSHMRIKFKDAEGENRSASVSTDTGNLIDNDSYVKRYELKSVAVNQTSYDKISDSIISEILRLENQ